MTDQRPEHGSGHRPRLHRIGSAHDRSRGLKIALLVKLLVVAAVVALFWLLELQVEIGATAMVLLHVALAGGLLIFAVQSGLLGGRRK